MADLRGLSRRKRKKRRRRRHDEAEESSGVATQSAAMAMLQQSIGNRAVQRMLDQEKAAKVQRQQDNEADAVEEVPEILSNVDLVEEYPVSDKLDDLDSGFRQSVEELIDVLEEAGARVDIIATVWPPERAYLMHFAWLIANEEIDPLAVPPIEEIEFDADNDPDLDMSWWHGSLEASITVAEEMVKAFGIDNLDEPPNLMSHHVTGEAIDMKITWGGKELILEDPLGESFIIASTPHDETNPDLIDLAAAFGVVHFLKVDENPIHWSVDGE